MEEEQLTPEAVRPDKLVKCLINNTVLIDVCGNVYHNSELKRKERNRIISQGLVVCDEHGSDNISTNIPKNGTLAQLYMF